MNNKIPSTQDYILELIKEVTGQKNLLVVPRIFISITKSLNSALLLSQVIYWSDKSKNRRYRNILVFAKTKEELQIELGLGRRALDNARHRLEELDLIKTKTGGFAGKCCILWQPLIPNIVNSIQRVVQENLSETNDDNSDYDEQLNGFNMSNNLDSLLNSDTYPYQNIQTDDCISNAELSTKRANLSKKSESPSIEKAISNTDITTDITQETTTNNLPAKRKEVEEGSFEGGNQNSIIHNDNFQSEMVKLISSINNNISEKEAQNYIDELNDALRDEIEITKEQYQIMLTFTAITRYSDYQRKDEKNGHTRTIIERWIDPTLTWVKMGITEKDIKTAMKQAITDDKHKMLRCPASYSPRVENCIVSSQTQSKYKDEEF